MKYGLGLKRRPFDLLFFFIDDIEAPKEEAESLGGLCTEAQSGENG
jgi:hypothetical protein